jgi:hypothetical protein
MATDNFMVLVQQNGQIFLSESRIAVDFADPFPGRPNIQRVPQAVFEVSGFSFQVVQPVAVRQSTGGKTTFAPLQLTRNVDRISPILFDMCASGTKFKYVDLLLIKSVGSTTGSPVTYSGYGLGAVTITRVIQKSAT